MTETNAQAQEGRTLARNRQVIRPCFPLSNPRILAQSEEPVNRVDTMTT
jgi:hypothetical protein